MNKLLIPNGGMPLDGDDFEWIHDGLFEAFRGALWWAIAGGENVIVRGGIISYSAPNASITEGFAVIGGEVCYIPAHSAAVSGLATSSLKIEETYDVSGSEVFADSVSRDTYAIRRAKISDTLSGGDEIALDAPARIFHEESFTSFSNGWLAVGGSTIKARLFNGMVSLSGALTAGDTNLTLFTLPAVFRPSAIRHCVIGNSDVDEFLRLVIQTDGQVLAFNAGSSVTYSGGKALYLDAAHFLL